MDWITSDIAIGDYREAQDITVLQRERIGSILGLIPTLRGEVPSALGVQRIEIRPLIDGPGNRFEDFREAVATLERLLAEAPPVLVHCRAGWGRSPVVVAGYFIRTRRLTVETALAEVAAKRRISILPDMRSLLVQLERGLIEV
jgi:protein-tyrosine phosphatase